MRILIDISHPGHVHLYKNIIWKLSEQGHEIKITVREKEITNKLLDSYGFKYELVTRHQTKLIDKAIDMVYRTTTLYGIIKNFKPDVLSGFCDNYLAQIGKLLGIPSVILTDTEHAWLQNVLTFPFSDKILTPNSFEKDLGTKQIKYAGYHELAYLHPDYYKPNKSYIGGIGFKPNQKYVFFRFVSWDASHDINTTGLSKEEKISLVNFFVNKRIKVLISSEGILPRPLKKYELNNRPENIHDVLNNAFIVISEGATTASESAVLGTPTIYTNKLRLGYIDELESKYDLIFQNGDLEKIINRCKILMNDDNIKEKFKEKRTNLIKDKIDVTQFVLKNILDSCNI